MAVLAARVKISWLNHGSLAELPALSEVSVKSALYGTYCVIVRVRFVRTKLSDLRDQIARTLTAFKGASHIREVLFRLGPATPIP